MPTTPATSTTTSTMSNLIQTAYDKYIEFNLRSEPMFRKFADKRPVDVTNPGNTVVFQVYTDLSRATSALTQTADPDAVELSNTNRVHVTVNEYGNAVLTTERLALESLSAIDPAVADMLSFNMRDSLDSLVWAKLTAVATGRYTGTSSADASLLAGLGLVAISTTLNQSTYTDAAVGNLWSGEIGIFDQVRYIETPRAESVSGSGTSKVYATVILGKQALLEAVSYEPKTVIGPVTDKLMRFRPAGWKGLLGWNVFRKEARYVIKSKSSIASA